MKLSEKTRWVTCKCGKTRQAYYPCGDEDIDEAKRWLESEDTSKCRACQVDDERSHDVCPELISSPGGIFFCKLGWRHTGRCEPSQKPIGSDSIT